jgi:hypothetical protein
MFEAFLKVVEALAGYIREYKKAKKERREAIATLYEQIGLCLANTARRMRIPEYPGGECGNILEFSEGLPDTVGDVIGNKKALEIAKILKKSHKVELEYAKLSQMKPEDRELELAKLDEAAGRFQALAKLIRAM